MFFNRVKRRALAYTKRKFKSANFGKIMFNFKRFYIEFSIGLGHRPKVLMFLYFKSVEYIYLSPLLYFLNEGKAIENWPKLKVTAKM
jgi:hypothetical protein